MNNTKPTPIDLVKYVKHTRECEARYFYVKPDAGKPEEFENAYGECDCGLFELLESLSLHDKKPMEYY